MTRTADITTVILSKQEKKKKRGDTANTTLEDVSRLTPCEPAHETHLGLVALHGTNFVAIEHLPNFVSPTCRSMTEALGGGGFRQRDHEALQRARQRRQKVERRPPRSDAHRTEVQLLHVGQSVSLSRFRSGRLHVPHALRYNVNI